MNPKPFDWILACFVAMALVMGFVLGCVGLGVILALAELLA